MADISYTRTTWADGSEGGTPIDATKLNNIEQGIVDAVAAIGPNDTTEDGTLKAQIDALGDSVSNLVQSTTVGITVNGGDEKIIATLPSSKVLVGVKFSNGTNWAHLIITQGDDAYVHAKNTGPSTATCNVSLYYIGV